MKSKKDQNTEQSHLDILKWGIVVVLFAAGVYAHYYFAHIALPLRIIGWIALAMILVMIALQTAQGAKVMGFAQASRTELRKVVWPTRQETVQTTLVVMAVVLLAGLILWGADTFLLWLVGWLTGQI